MLQSFNSRRRLLRSVLAGEACILPAPVYDPVSAVLAEEIGFEMGMVAGSAVSTTVLAAPDIVVLTLTELADQVRRISRASSLPLLVDADHGYGNASNAIRTVEELEAAGAAGLTLEDTDMPRRYGSAGSSLVPADEIADRVAAAVSARHDPDLVIVGRTSLRLTTLEDAVLRAKSYEAAGADAIFMHGVRTEHEIEAFRRAIGVPLIAGSGLPPELLGSQLLAAAGVRIALYGHQALHASILAVEQALTKLRSGGPLKDLPLADPALLQRANRKDRFDAQSRHFMAPNRP